MTRMLVDVKVNIEHINLDGAVYEIANAKPRKTIMRGLTKKEALAIKEKGTIMRKTKKDVTA